MSCWASSKLDSSNDSVARGTASVTNAPMRTMPALDLVQFFVEGLAQFSHFGLWSGAQPNRPVT